MTRRLSFSIAVLVALIVLYVVVLRVAPPPDRKTPQKAPPTASAKGGAGPEMPGPYPTEYDEVAVSVEIPPLSEFPSAWAESGGCPHSRMIGVLGAAIGPGNGCPVLTVEPDGPADKAGIKRFDRLGEREVCPNTIYPSFKPGEEARTVEWTVRRPKGEKSDDAEAEERAAKAEL